MGPAALRILLFVLILFGGTTGVAAAGIDLDSGDELGSTVSTVTSEVGDVTDATGDLTGIVDDTTDAVTGSVDDAAGSLGSTSGTLDSVAGSVENVLSGSTSGADSASSSPDSTSTSSGGSGGTSSRSGTSSSTTSRSASNQGSPRTRFDQLPRRYETLLERIESGIRVQASIARLRTLLAFASPELRAKILRLIREEIRRLEKEGLTKRERAAVKRLRPLLDHFGLSVLLPDVSFRMEGTNLSGTASEGLKRALAGSAGSELRHSDESGSGGNGFAQTPVFPLPSPSSPAYWLLVLLAAVSGALYLATRAPRHLLPAAVRGMVEVRTPQLWALAVTIGLVAVIGAAIVIDALLL